jgi:hypothetical protein
MTREIVKATPADAGCYVEGWWGQYAVAHMIQRATEFGYEELQLEALAARHLDQMGGSTPTLLELTDTEHEVMQDASDDVESWLNEHAAPEDYSFGWQDGEFFLASDAWWEDDTFMIEYDGSAT